jgi:hypothetical protein
LTPDLPHAWEHQHPDQWQRDEDPPDDTGNSRVKRHSPMVRGKICQWRKLEQASNIEMDSIRSDWKIETGEENRETPDSAKIKRGRTNCTHEIQKLIFH